MPASVSLSRMVDLALGTPELGAVNFNVLHTLLHAVLGKLDLQNVKADINEFDKDFLMKKSKSEPELGDIKEAAEQDDADSAITGMTDGGLTDTDRVGSASSIPYSKPPYHQLEEKVAKLEEQMESLNKIPTNKALFERSKGDGEKVRPVSDLWQTMQIQKRVDNNEEGVGKLMSLVEDLMSEMQTLKDENDKLKKEMEKRWKDYLAEMANKKPPTPPPSEEPGKDLDELMKKLKYLEDLTNKLAKDLAGMPGPDEWGNFVTWEGLEKLLRGLREDLTPGERVVIEMNTQTDIPSRAVSRASTPGPSAELMEILERLGSLTEKHDLLEERVKELEEQLKNKADKDMLDGLSVPDDLLKQLKDIQDQLDAMKKGQDKDSDAVARMQQAILQLQAELERLSNTTQNLVDENNNKTKDIESLYKLCNGLEDTKADKEFVQSEVEVKADKRQLEGKVNRSLFDSTTEELNKMISDILNKLAGNDEEWKKLLDQMGIDLDGKLDRLEFGPWRDELERQLKALAKKLQGMNFQGPMEDDDAAGIRKQLIQRFNCISCDRPVDMLPQGPIPSIPAPQGMPATRSARPYTTYELEQIRQHARSYTNPQIDVMDLYQTSRACGGNHTLTYPNKRLTRLTQLNNLFREETDIPVFTKEEQDIQGADGHIYKGRHDAGTKLPNLGPQQMGGSSPKMSRKAQPAPRPPQTTTPRPVSARLTGRPKSGALLGSRPTSAVDHKVPMPPPEVAVAREVGSPPPPPAPSELEPRDTPSSPTPAQN